MVHVSRFLDRSCYSLLRNSVSLGGFIVYHHFMESAEKPKEREKKLGAGELQSVFGEEQGFEVLLNEERFADDGRPASFFVSQKMSCPFRESKK